MKLKKTFKLAGLSIAILSVTCAFKGNLSNEKDKSSFDEQGHRGARGLMPENTIPAMYKAIDLGITTLEMDLQVSKDKQVVVSHDSYFGYKFCLTPEGKEMTDKDGRSRLIVDMPYDSIRKYDVGMKSHPDFPRQQKMPAYKPLLSELIDSAETYARKKKHVNHYNMEIKTSPEYKDKGHPPVPEFVALAMKVVYDKKIEKRTTIQSFDTRSLKLVKAGYPEVKISYLVFKSNTKNIDEHIKDLGFKPDVFSPEYHLVTEELVKACRDRNIKVIPWTVNTVDDIKKLKALRVDGIISDYPDLFKSTN
ncbi:glycerophosphodiester phosphodiesterase family protein [Pseudopedobacter sp.]|uniref:glycerophosphodiester phosphodiesterase family protein n=1 Tax=Pseudopedobacter sp. TaxID=1936787 RepID=UPI00334253D9